MNTKSQSISFQAIVIAVLVLIVMIVIWAIFTGQIGKTSKAIRNTSQSSIDNCKDDFNGEFLPRSECLEVGIVIPGDFNQPANQVCCKKV
ncbi:MAG: hypothetical protein KJ601_01040 [Nanoarchaeota archaeon]|nr:hypothetical protein [Nanoarchaeota archaeon]